MNANHQLCRKTDYPQAHGRGGQTTAKGQRRASGAGTGTGAAGRPAACDVLADRPAGAGRPAAGDDRVTSTATFATASSTSRSPNGSSGRARRSSGETLPEILGAEAYRPARADDRGGAGGRAAVLRRHLRPSDARACWRRRPTIRRGSTPRPARSTGSSSSSPTSPSSAATEKALRESEERFRRIANSAPVLMWVTRLDRVRDFVNDAYAEFACGPGCDPEEARTLDWKSQDPSRRRRAGGRRVASPAKRR